MKRKESERCDKCGAPSTPDPYYSWYFCTCYIVDPNPNKSKGGKK